MAANALHTGPAARAEPRRRARRVGRQNAAIGGAAAIVVGLVAPWVPGCRACDPGDETATIRWASSSNRLYVGTSGPGCITLGDIYTLRLGSFGLPMGPLFQAEGENTWLLTSELFVQNGSVLELHGSAVGGDCDELRLLSNDATQVHVRAYGGNVSVSHAKVFSWDDTLDPPGVDTNASDGRAYLAAISELGPYVSTQTGESRLDIVSSEVAYLGSPAATETAGLVWRVRGFNGNNTDLFDSVNVYGDLRESDLHHNFHGPYAAAGLQSANWSYNTVHDNTEYGLDLQDDSDDVTVHNNTIYNNGESGIMASGRCSGLSVERNWVFNCSGGGVEVARSSDNASVVGNTCVGNGGAGVAVVECFRVEVADNLMDGNQHGVQLSLGSAGNLVRGNVMRNTEEFAIYMFQSGSTPEVEGNTGRPNRNVVFNNVVFGAGEGVKTVDADLNVITFNTFAGVNVLRFKTSLLNLFALNHVTGGVDTAVESGSCMDQASSFGRRCDDGQAVEV